LGCTPGIINIIIICLFLLLIRGTKESALINNILSYFKVTVVVVFIALGWGFTDGANHSFHPVMKVKV
jgi:APA family basic amino acid/polyamine antiporter